MVNKPGITTYYCSHRKWINTSAMPWNKLIVGKFSEVDQIRKSLSLWQCATSETCYQPQTLEKKCFYFWDLKHVLVMVWDGDYNFTTGFKANYAQNLMQQHHFHGPFKKKKKVKHAAMHFGENTLFLDHLCVL